MADSFPDDDETLAVLSTTDPDDEILTGGESPGSSAKLDTSTNPLPSSSSSLSGISADLSDVSMVDDLLSMVIFPSEPRKEQIEKKN